MTKRKFRPCSQEQRQRTLSESRFEEARRHKFRDSPQPVICLMLSLITWLYPREQKSFDNCQSQGFRKPHIGTLVYTAGCDCMKC